MGTDSGGRPSQVRTRTSSKDVKYQTNKQTFDVTEYSELSETVNVIQAWWDSSWGHCRGDPHS